MGTTLVLVGHSARRIRALVVGMAAVLGGFQLLLAAMADWLTSRSAFGQIEGLVPPGMRQLMGQSMFSLLSGSGIVALGYFHTAVEAALVILVIVAASEPADEIEAGFADLALSRPTRRSALMTRTLLLTMAAPTIVVAVMGLGTAAGARWVMPATAAGPAPRVVWSLMLNLWALLIAWGGIAMAVASASRKRSHVLAIVGTAALISLLIDYLARAWTAMQWIAWISPFHFYSPLDLLMGAVLPAGDLAVLAGIASTGAAVAYVVFTKRDL